MNDMTTLRFSLGFFSETELHAIIWEEAQRTRAMDWKCDQWE